MYDLRERMLKELKSARERDEPVLRAYRKSDRENIRKLCCDSGYLGDPIDVAFSDRELFAAIFIDPYLDFYPDWTFIVEHQGTVVGYLSAAIGIKYFIGQIRTGCFAFGRLLRGRLVGEDMTTRNDRTFLHWLFFCSWRERVRRPPTMAHMHFCIHPNYRGQFLAQRLWSAFEYKLKAHGIVHYYGEVITCKPRQVIRVYERYGLKLYDQAPSSMFAHIDDRPIWSVCIAK